MPPLIGQRAPDKPILYGPDGKPWRRDQSLGDMALPHVLSYASILSGAWKTYYHQNWDEAYRHAREDALAMRRDCFLMAPYDERRRAVVSVPWHIDVPDTKDPRQVAVADAITRAIEQISDLPRILWALLDAVWYGRYGTQIRWKWIEDEKAQRELLTVRKWLPVNGDKIGHHHDGTPYVLVHGGDTEALGPSAEIIYTTVAKALLLRSPQWRNRFIIHTHEIDDADYFDVEAAEAVHGVGIRSRIFWLNWIRLEYAAHVSDFLERVGLGITVWYYELGNPQSEAAVRAAARNQTDRMNILLPRTAGDTKGAAGIERIETPAAGAEVIKALQEVVRGDIERYIIGQTLSSKSEGSGLGGSGVAGMHKDTKTDIRDQDAERLAETLTGTEENPGLVWMIQRWSFPETLPGQKGGFRCRWKFDLESPESKEKLESAKTMVDFGVDLKADEVRAAGGYSKPEPGDEVVKGKPQQQGWQPGCGMPGQGQPGQAPPGQAPPPGQPGQAPAPGQPTPEQGAPEGQPGAPPPQNAPAPETPAPTQPEGSQAAPASPLPTASPQSQARTRGEVHARDLAEFLTALQAAGVDESLLHDQAEQGNAELQGTGFSLEQGPQGWRVTGSGKGRLAYDPDQHAQGMGEFLQALQAAGVDGGAVGSDT